MKEYSQLKSHLNFFACKLMIAARIFEVMIYGSFERIKLSLTRINRKESIVRNSREKKRSRFCEAIE